MIEFRHTSFRFRGNDVIRDLSFSLTDGEHAAVVGPTGSGKSMLLQALAGKIQPHSGTGYFEFSGVKIDHFAMYKEALLISFNEKSKYFDSGNHFYQQRYTSLEDKVSKSITVKDYLGEVYSNHTQESLMASLALLGIAHLHPRKLIQLSSGQRKKLMLLRAILHPPRLLLLDDPYMGLDAQSRDDLNGILQKLTNKGMQLVLVARETDIPAFVTRRIPLEKINGSDAQSREQLPEIPYISSSFDVLVEFKNVTVRYGSSTVLDTVNFALLSGQKTALIGNNGSGKSTFLSLIYADHPQAYANSITLFDIKRGSGESIWDIKKQIGFSSPELHLYFPSTLKAWQVIGTGFFPALALARQLDDSQRRRIAEFAVYFGIKHLLDRTFGSLSTGEQRTLLFIRALINPRPLVLLDEPYQGMDDRLIAKANHLLDHMFESTGSLLFISHYEKEIPTCVTTKMYLQEGRLKRVVE